jgi:hypothetical protein
MQVSELKSSRYYFRCIAVAMGAIVLATSVYAIQGNSAVLAVASPASFSARSGSLQQETPSSQDLSKITELMAELGHLQTKLHQELQFPALRYQSRLLSLLPASTALYVSLPNYGDTLHQAVQIFHQELQENSGLRDRWQTFPAGPMVEEGLEKVYQFFQYLGNEIVVAGEIKGSPVIVAEIRKPGLEPFLQGLIKQFGGASSVPIRILNPQQLLTAKNQRSTHAVVLVRSDVVVVAFELAALKSFNAKLNRAGGKLATVPFGQRLAQSYQGGADMLLGVDLQQAKSQIPLRTRKDVAVFEQTGFADVKYLIAERKTVEGQTADQAELAFNGPRRGIASWLAAPAPMGGLDFVSPSATIVSALVLKSPAQIFDDLKGIAGASDPNSQAGLAQAEAMLNINLKDDLFSKLGKEITVALDGPIVPIPSWKVVLQVKDPNGLQQTLKQLLAAANSNMKQGERPTLDQQTEDGLTYYTVRYSSMNKPTEVDYAFVDGYAVIAPSRALVSEAVRIHHSGNSMAKSSEFQALLPKNGPSEASAVLYEDVKALLVPVMQQTSPEMAQVFEKIGLQIKPFATFAYGEESAIRAASSSQGFNASMILVTAAVAIPNLMRSRTTANEAAAASTMRTLNTAQVTYSITYSKKNYAPDLATLGPGPSGTCRPNSASANHACLLDSTLGNAHCTSGVWCTTNSFRYTMTATCKEGVCDDYVIVATPVSPSTGNKSFCSIQDAVIRSKPGPPLTSPPSASECESWDPL